MVEWRKPSEGVTTSGAEIRQRRRRAAENAAKFSSVGGLGGGANCRVGKLVVLQQNANSSAVGCGGSAMATA